MNLFNHQIKNEKIFLLSSFLPDYSKSCGILTPASGMTHKRYLAAFAASSRAKQHAGSGFATGRTEIRYLCATYIMKFSEAIIQWYLQARRPLPWRETTDPYLIWLSEIMLQQTRVDQGLGYYHRFASRFPDVFALAKASEQEVLKLWQGLGYYSRARNLLHTARTVAKEHAGVFPADYVALAALKGIGPYTAAAILSIAFHQPYPVVDANVLRVMARYLAIRSSVNEAAAKKNIASVLHHLIDHASPGDFNQAMMELGALVCKPQNPDCGNCPLSNSCKAYKQGKANHFPVKAEKAKTKKRFLNYLVMTEKIGSRRYIYINKRRGDDIWKNLYDFPLIETTHPHSLKELQKSEDWKNIVGKAKHKVSAFGDEIQYKLTHRELRVRFVEIEVLEKLPSGANFTRTAWTQLDKYPFPRLIENYLAQRFHEAILR
jgi:A/G-specific adenine glycosylase